MSTGDKNDAFSEYAGYVTYRIAQLSSKLNVQGSRLLRTDVGLSVVHWRILALVRHSAPVNSAAVVKAVAMDAGQFSRNLKSLIANGLIKSELDSEDNRRQVLSCTRKGLRTYEAAAPIMQKRRKALMKEISSQDRDAFFRVLTQLDKNLTEHEVNTRETA